MNTHKTFSLIVVVLLAFAWAGIPMPVSADDPLPYITFTRSNNWVSGNYWPSSVSILIMIDDPATPQNPDFFENQTSDGSGNFGYRSAYDIQTGFTVYGTDGNTIKQLTVSNFEVLEINWDTDMISGIGTPNTNAIVQSNNPPGWIPFVIPPSGNWQVDFTGIADITPQSGGFANEQDANGDRTQSNWMVPQIEIQLNQRMGNDDVPQDIIMGHGWPIGHTVNLAIDDPSTPLTPDYSANQVSELGEWDLVATFIIPVEFELEPGFIVTMTDGVMEKSLTVPPMDVTEIDFTADTIRGTVTPGTEVRIKPYGSFPSIPSNLLLRIETADANGNWEADFSVPGDEAGEEGTYDLQPTQHLTVYATQFDDDNNRTRLRKRGLNSSIVVDKDGDIVIATDFTPGTQVTMTIDDPGNGAGIDLTRSGVIYLEEGGWNCQWGHCSLFDLRNEFHVRPGQLITITDGVHTYIHTVTSLRYGVVDMNASIVSGTADPHSEIYLEIYNEVENEFITCQRHIFADANGDWLADFSVPGVELFEQTTCDFNNELFDVYGGTAYQHIDGGETWIGWPASFPEAFDKSSPLNNATNQSVAPTLSWEASSGATSYEYCYDTSNNYTCNSTWISSGLNTTANISGLASGTTYYWQVRAKINDGYTTYANGGTWWTFTTKQEITKIFYSTAAQDGWILESTETSNTGDTLNSTASTLNLGDDSAKKQYRAILSFNTSSLPDNAVITKVTLKLKRQGVAGGGNPVAMFQGFMVDIKKGTFGTAPLALADFKATASKTVGPQSPALTAGWYNLNLTPAKAYVNRLATNSGLTQMRLRFKLDDNNNAVANFLKLYSGNAGAANRPQLIIEYYVP